MIELKKSLKRIYTRFVVLTALVVFGAIAIAQGKKDGPEIPAAGFAAQEASFDSAPIPMKDVALANFEESSVESLDDLPPARADIGELNADPMPPSEPQAIQDVDARPVPNNAVTDQELESVNYDDLQPVDDYATDDYAPSDFAPSDYAADDFGSDETDLDTEASRRNPFRGAEADDGMPAPRGYDDSELETPALMPVEGGADSGYDDTLPPGAADEYEAPANDFVEPAGIDPGYDAGYDAVDAPAAAGNYQQEQSAPQTRRAAVPAPRQPVVQPSAERQYQTNQRDAEFTQREQIEEQLVPSMAVARRSESLPSASGKPGPQSMEGPQTPTLTVQKVAPKEVQVGQPASFEIRVRNVGRIAADNIVVRDEIPAGTRFVDSSPKATRAGNGTIIWEAGSLPPGQEYNISVQVVPMTEGQVGSVATVSFETSASARTKSTKPSLTLEHVGPKKVLVGDAVRFTIKLSNPGTGQASNVILEEDVPTGLSHSSGPKLEYEVGSIRPGQTRHLELTLKAAEAGRVLNTLIARADGGLVVEDVTELEVVKPKLQVGIEGPGRRYLERKATYTVTVANPGTAPAKNVELTARLPRGLKFVSTNNSGYYDQKLHAVVWNLEQLPAGEMGRAQFTAMPIEMGDYEIRAEGKAEMGLTASREHPLRVDGIAALLFTVQDQVDPIEVGGQTSYAIRVVNQGSKDATNVQIAAAIPNGMRPLGGQGPTTERIEGQQVIFAPIDRLPAKGEVTYKILVQGTAANDYRIRVQMTSDDITSAVIKEESTRVYSD